MQKGKGLGHTHLSTYRSEIDGLRAVAVLSVIVFHFSAQPLAGGYLGVDIFFVLSGFLITSIIWREMLNGNFSIARFYDRRIRRIIPALLFLLTTTSILALFILLPSDLGKYAKSVLATIVFATNVFFFRDTGYFSSAAEEKPLLHLWSLGIEEQFYIFFPLLLMFVAVKAKKYTFALVAAFSVCSLLLSAFLLSIDLDHFSFYLLPPRAWELGAGALVALWARPASNASRPAAILAWVGLALITFGLITGKHFIPAFIPEAITVVLGTSLFILAAHDKAAGKLMSSRPLVFIGLISYSLYLWHWPAIVFSKYFLVRDLYWHEITLAVIFMFTMAIVSWRWIERPFRSSALPIFNVRLSAAGGMTAMLLVGTLVLVMDGVPQRFDVGVNTINAAAGSNFRCSLSNTLISEGVRMCALHLPSRNPQDADVVLLGNSHALMYAPAFSNTLKRNALNAVLITPNGCIPSLGVNINDGCAGIARRNIERIVHMKRVRAVIIGTTWTHDHISPQTTAAELDKTIARLRSAGKKVVLIGPVATPDWDAPSVASRSLAFGHPLMRTAFEPQAVFDHKFAQVIAAFERRSDIEFYRPDKLLCIKQRCEYFLNHKSLFADNSGHLSAIEVERFRPGLEVALMRALRED
jgi:peptidoglycan/LPS O-acetylase OafA/YrhL